MALFAKINLIYFIAILTTHTIKISRNIFSRTAPKVLISNILQHHSLQELLNLHKKEQL
ncbi:hypothetical protein KBB68_02015 [Candidatus Babeliales bacterium]|nr:hypothetical protein [Candidatus Babeliales bacterium]